MVALALWLAFARPKKGLKMKYPIIAEEMK